MGELIGVLAAVASSAIGGTAIGATRYLVGVLDPLTIGAFRFGIGCLVLALAVGWQQGRWPMPGERARAAGLGLLFFALFPVLLNASLVFTSAARGALALSTLPLLTMAVGAALGIEKLTGRKALGVVVAILGVGLALVGGLGTAPAGAWRGDLLMIAAALCMAFYNVWSRPMVRAIGAVPFTLFGMTLGAVVLALASGLGGGYAALPVLDMHQWLALLYLGVFGGAVALLLWVYALGRTTPTRVAIAVCVNPLTASVVGATMLGEPLGWPLALGLVAVASGISLAATDPRRSGGEPRLSWWAWARRRRRRPGACRT